MSKLCECGCGRQTSVAKRMRKRNGVIVQRKDEPNRFVFGHGRRTLPFVLNRAGYPRKKLSADHPFAAMADANGYVTLHRLVMAEALGRPLRREEIVHHIDEDIKNFALENLMLFESNGEHRRHHAALRRARGVAPS
jgi:hypothetical protein